MDITAAVFLFGGLLEHLALILIVMVAPRYANHAFQTGNARLGQHALQSGHKPERALIQKIAGFLALTQTIRIQIAQQHELALHHALLLWGLVIQASSQIAKLIAEAPITIAQTTSG